MRDNPSARENDCSLHVANSFLYFFLAHISHTTTHLLTGVPRHARAKNTDSDTESLQTQTTRGLLGRGGPSRANRGPGAAGIKPVKCLPVRAGPCGVIA